MMRQSRRLVIALVGLVLLCQACGRAESTSPVPTVHDPSAVSATGLGYASLAEHISETTNIDGVYDPPDEQDTSDIFERTSEVAENESSGVMGRRPVSYLEKVIPPCVPLEGYEQDPCPQITFTRENSSVGASTTLLRELPTFTEVLMGTAGGALATPHIVIRGTFRPDTTRCDLYPLVPFDYDPNQGDTSWYYRFMDHVCFMEIRVNEYIIGEGPPELTIAVRARAIRKHKLGDDNTIPEEYESEAHSRISIYPGKEVVMMLGPPWSVAVEAWYLQRLYLSLWFVQRNENEVRAVSEDTIFTDNPELLSQMNLPLDELIRKIKEAAEERFVLTGGRIGVDSSLPMLVTDANKLQNFYQKTGAVYEGEGATVLPPPVPGGEEPEEPPTRAREEQPEATTIPAPGDETSPAPTDDADYSSSTTTLPQTGDTSTTSTGATSASTTLPQAEASSTTAVTAPSSTTLPLAEDTLPAVTTTAVLAPTGATQPQVEDTLSTTTSTAVLMPTGTTQPQAGETIPVATTTTAVPSDGTATTLPQPEETLPPTTTGTTAGPGAEEPGGHQAEDADPAPAGTVPSPGDDTGVPEGGEGSGVGAG